MPLSFNSDIQNFLALSGKAPGTYTSADQQNVSGKGVVVVLDTTNINGATITVTIQGKDVTSGKYYTLLVSTGIASNTTTVLTVYPGLTASANVVANNILPRTWRVSVVIATATPTAATLGACVMD
jgi:hypothetical protein